MINNIFQAKYKSLELWKKRALSDMERLIPGYYKRGIEVYPHQIEAAVSALSNPYSKGYMLCDETGLGKSIEALLVITQLYLNGSNNIVIIVPNQLVGQWRSILDKFDLPNTININDCIRQNSPLQDGYISAVTNDHNDERKVLVLSYNQASESWEKLKSIKWDLAVFEEAHRLRKYYTNENATATNLHNAFIGIRKLLLTATPMQSNVMDLFGLINFIDDTVFTDDKNFYKRYYKMPDNYNELRDRLLPFTYRTLRNQVKLDVSLTDRTIHTQEYNLNEKEKVLYSLLDRYINKTNKIAFPEMDTYDLNLMMFKLFSSSIYALTKTLHGVHARLNKIETIEAKAESAEITKIIESAEGIKDTSKWEVFYKGLKQGLDNLKAKGLAEKVIVFTENKKTQEYLLKQFAKIDKKLKVTCYETVADLKAFSKRTNVLIATDLASEGFNLEFCSFIINYDLPWNVQKIEQRIGRCQRIGQKNNVFIINFLNKENYADVRFYELVFKRTTMFDGILGSSDNLISDVKSGSVNTAVDMIMGSSKTGKEIESDFIKLQNEYKDHIDNTKDVSNTMLFNTFSENAVEKTKNYASYIKKKCEQLRLDLWEFCEYAFQPYGTVDSEKHHISMSKSPFASGNLPAVNLSMDDEVSRDGKISLANKIVKKVAERIDFDSDKQGRIHFRDNNGMHAGKSGYISLYNLQVCILNNDYQAYSILRFVGVDKEGERLSHDECESIFNLQALSSNICNVSEDVVSLINEQFEQQKPIIISRANEDNISWITEQTRHIRNRFADRLFDIVASIEQVEKDISKLKSGSKEGEYSTAFMKNQQIANLTKQLNKLKQNEFIEKMKINKEKELAITSFKDSIKLSVFANKSFVVEFSVEIKC